MTCERKRKHAWNNTGKRNNSRSWKIIVWPPVSSRLICFKLSWDACCFWDCNMATQRHLLEHRRYKENFSWSSFNFYLLNLCQQDWKVPCASSQSAITYTVWWRYTYTFASMSCICGAPHPSCQNSWVFLLKPENSLVTLTWALSSVFKSSLKCRHRDRIQ